MYLTNPMETIFSLHETPVVLSALCFLLVFEKMWSLLPGLWPEGCSAESNKGLQRSLSLHFYITVNGSERLDKAWLAIYDLAPRCGEV